MTPIRMRYEAAYNNAHPFDKLVDGIMQPTKVQETVDIMLHGVGKREFGVVIITKIINHIIECFKPPKHSLLQWTSRVST